MTFISKREIYFFVLGLPSLWHIATLFKNPRGVFLNNHMMSNLQGFASTEISYNVRLNQPARSRDLISNQGYPRTEPQFLRISG